MSGSAMHIASRARSRRSREVSSADAPAAGTAAPRGARRDAPPGRRPRPARRSRGSRRPPVPSPSPAPGRGGRRPCGPARRRLAPSPIVGQDRGDLVERFVAGDRRGTSVRSSTRPDLEVGQLAGDSTRARKRSGPSTRASFPPGRRLSASPRRVAASAVRPPRRCARTIAAWPASSASSANTTSLTTPARAFTWSGVIAVPITATAPRPLPDGGRSRRCSPRPRPRGWPAPSPPRARSSP